MHSVGQNINNSNRSNDDRYKIELAVRSVSKIENGSNYYDAHAVAFADGWEMHISLHHMQIVSYLMNSKTFRCHLYTRTGTNLTPTRSWTRSSINSSRIILRSITCVSSWNWKLCSHYTNKAICRKVKSCGHSGRDLLSAVFTTSHHRRLNSQRQMKTAICSQAMCVYAFEVKEHSGTSNGKRNA